MSRFRCVSVARRARRRVSAGPRRFRRFVPPGGGLLNVDAKTGVRFWIEREANGTNCRVTHWVVPSASARSPREPRFLQVLSDYDTPVHHSRSKMWARSTVTFVPSRKVLLAKVNYKP